MVEGCEIAGGGGVGGLEYHSIPEGVLCAALRDHWRWLQSDGKEGIRLDLSGADLSGVTLAGTDLRRAILAGADLTNADFSFSDLSNAVLSDGNLRDTNLRRSKLAGAIFKDAQLYGADLYGADLRAGDLSGARCLLECQLAGTNLSNCALPIHMAQFSSLEQAREISNQARNLLWIAIGACVISWITLLVTSDGTLLANSGSTLVPVVKIDVPIQAFFWLMPLVLLGLYFYLHFQLQDLWTELSCLPSVFPDGTSLDQRVYLWLMTGLVRANIPFMNADKRPFSRSKLTASIAVVWGLVPFTLFLFWLKYLGLHHVVGTVLHIVLLAVSVWFGFAFHGSATKILRGETLSICSTEDGLEDSWLDMLALPRAGSWMVVAILVCFPAFSWIAISRPDLLPRSQFPGLLRNAATANLRLAEISYRPADWYRLSETLREDPLIVKGPILENMNLRGARATEAFLANARLADADLCYADLEGADLRKADLSRANLQKTNLRNAKLQGAHLTGANLENAVLKSASVQSTICGSACLKGADLYGSNLQNANLVEACLCEANLGEANLEGAFLQSADLRGARLWKADLKGAFFHKTLLHGADLSEAKNLTAEQIGGACGDQNTKLPPELTPVASCDDGDQKPCECSKSP